jgi:uncharacterized membrane protein
MDMEHLQPGNQLMTAVEIAQREHDAEQASNVYVMSLITFAAGLPLPIINVISTIMFFIGSRRESAFVRWHCMQALITELVTLPLNSVAFWWTVNLVFFDTQITNMYIAYMIVIGLLNAIELVASIRAAIRVRKHKPVRWFLVSDIADRLVGEGA